jgi:hypothetical protein
LKGGERLMLIGNWSDCDVKNNLNLNQTKYYMVLNGKKINLKQLNKHVLECILPEFDCYSNYKKYLPENSTCLESLNISTTFINVYENDKLFCSPIPFKIKYSASNEKKTPNTSSAQILNSQENTNYKIKLFLLERTLMLLKHYNLSEIEFDYYVDNTNGNVLSNSNTQQISAFEKRICKLIVSLTNHIFFLRANKHILKNSNNKQYAKLALENEHEGKTLLHLSSEIGFAYLLEKLGNMRNHVKDDLSLEFSLIKNELQLNKSDEHGNTPIVRNFLVLFSGEF